MLTLCVVLTLAMLVGYPLGIFLEMSSEISILMIAICVASDLNIFINWSNK